MARVVPRARTVPRVVPRARTVRVKSARGAEAVTGVFADRPFESQANGAWLEDQTIANGLCPRSPRELAAKKTEATFQSGQRRRAQTEARIAILKNVFLSNPLRRRGFKNRERQLGWSVLAHTLWVLSRLERAPTQTEALPQAA